MANNKGTVIQVMGPVLDIRFADDQLPLLLSAIEIPAGDHTIVWVKTAEEGGAIFIRDVEDRDEILRVAFEKLGIDAPIGDEESETFL